MIYFIDCALFLTGPAGQVQPICEIRGKKGGKKVMENHKIKIYYVIIFCLKRKLL